jgi:hypothetical protein
MEPALTLAGFGTQSPAAQDAPMQAQGSLANDNTDGALDAPQPCEVVCDGVPPALPRIQIGKVTNTEKKDPNSRARQLWAVVQGHVFSGEVKALLLKKRYSVVSHELHQNYVAACR